MKRRTRDEGRGTKKWILILNLLSIAYSPSVLALSDDGLEALDIFSKVLRYVEEEYVEPIDDKKLIHGGIKGMLLTLDPHTSFMPPEVYKDLRSDTRGRFGGVGVEITIRDGWLTVVAPIEGTPAARAGLESGDQIVRLEGESTKNMSLADAVAKMRGKEGSAVRMTVLRKGEKKTFELVLKREVIRVPTVKTEILDDHYGYVRISSFTETSSNDLRKALKKLEKEDALHGLMLDLRNNPGGLFEQSVKVADLFLKQGLIVTTESRGKEVDRREAGDDGNEKNFPLIILVNGGSASASEIVAGALQDQKRGVVLGTRTFGKGSVQTVVELEDGSALKLTVARYFTPKRRSIQADGIRPDIVVENISPQAREGKTSTSPIREEDLEGHLEGTTPAGEKRVSATAGLEDYQKRVALGYLKSWDLFK